MIGASYENDQFGEIADLRAEIERLEGRNHPQGAGGEMKRDEDCWRPEINEQEKRLANSMGTGSYKAHPTKLRPVRICRWRFLSDEISISAGQY